MARHSEAARSKALDQILVFLHENENVTSQEFVTFVKSNGLNETIDALGVLLSMELSSWLQIVYDQELQANIIKVYPLKEK